MTQDPKKGGFWRSMVAVAWAMLGVRKGKEYEKDFASITPLTRPASSWVSPVASVDMRRSKVG